MAQNDLIKDIIFIADEQREAPAFARGIALGYLLALVAAELLTTFVTPLAGMILFGLILLALLVQSSLEKPKGMQPFLLAFSLVPLIRLLVMTVPLSSIDPVYWYLLIGVLLSIAVVITARLAGFSRSTLGMRVSKHQLPLQLLIGFSGLGIGFFQYLILRPDPLFSPFRWSQFLLLALVLLVFGGLLLETVFRGLLQTSAVQVFGPLGILYAAFSFSVLYVGNHSLIGIIFILLVSLAFGVIAARTRSLVGVSLSHGLANISLLLIFPFLIAAAPGNPETPMVISLPSNSTPTRVATQTPPAQEETQSMVLIPITGRTATSSPTAEQMPACNSHPGWVVYITQLGENLETISADFGISPEELSIANCFDENYQVKAGRGLFVPYDIIHSPTPTLPVLFASLNTPTTTPTKKPARKPTATATSKPVQEVTPIPALPTSTLPPTFPTQNDLPTLAPTQLPPPAPPTAEN